MERGGTFTNIVDRYMGRNTWLATFAMLALRLAV
jgi:hypothetical protein